MDTLYTSWDSITHNKAESINFLELMNSATKKGSIRVTIRAIIGVLSAKV